MNEDNDISLLLAKLHELHGMNFIKQLKRIIECNEFTPLDTGPQIFIMGGEESEDYSSLLAAARKAVEHGNTVYILPNPKGTRTADFIFERKGILKLYDLKTIHGKSSAGNRLLESIGQSNRVLLNMNTDYNARLLASDIKSYFASNKQAIEVLIYKGKKSISVTRNLIDNTKFYRQFRKNYEK